MGHTIHYWGRFVLFMDLSRSFYPHLDDTWDQTCKIIKFTVKLARPYYTSPYFFAYQSPFIKLYKIHKHLYKVKHGLSEDLINLYTFNHILVRRISNYLGHYGISITTIDLLCQNQFLFEYLWASHVEYRYYISQQSIILVITRDQSAPI